MEPLDLGLFSALAGGLGEPERGLRVPGSRSSCRTIWGTQDPSGIPVLTAGIPLLILLPCFPSGPHFSCPVGSITRVVFRPKPLGILIRGKEVDASVIWGMLAGNDAWEWPQGFVLVQLPARRHLKGKTSASKGLSSKDGSLGGDLGRSSLCFPAPLLAGV